LSSLHEGIIKLTDRGFGVLGFWGFGEKKTKYVKAYENTLSSMKLKGGPKPRKLVTDEDESICDPKISDEGRANTIHFSKNLKQL